MAYFLVGYGQQSFESTFNQLLKLSDDETLIWKVIVGDVHYSNEDFKNINQVDCFGNTALHYICARTTKSMDPDSNFDMLRLVIEQFLRYNDLSGNLQIALKNKFNETPMDLCKCMHKTKQIVEHIIKWKNTIKAAIELPQAPQIYHIIIEYLHGEIPLRIISQNYNFPALENLACAKCRKIQDGKVILKICGQCRKVFYCSEECQLADWLRHCQECIK